MSHSKSEYFRGVSGLGELCPVHSSPTASISIVLICEQASAVTVTVSWSQE